ncbi:MAG: aldehyde ferredoxin oxidoreductase family protein [Deltaproteobacteria bacterium]|nr:aldehyde ferredoxin oxidoreductase family protein [Deltaproteobacteria bacterium]
MSNYRAKILDLDLTTGNTTTTTIDEDVQRKFLGGSGLAAKMFLDRVSPDVDPLSPENVLFVTNGPLSGNTLPGGSRFTVCAKSPLTNIWGESCCGGNFANGLKVAGYDGIAIAGASDKPVYFLIEGDKVEIKDASDIWGKGTYETEDLLKERHKGQGKVRVLSIGQAGENLVRYAAICNLKRDFVGRTGMGAVMGSKKLKAIVVCGTGKVTQASPDAFAAKRKEIIAKAKEHIVPQALGGGGTISALDFGVFLGDVPGKNWTQGDMTAFAPKIGGEMLNSEKYLTGAESCHGCTVGCKRVVSINEGPYKGMAGPGPEYEGAASLGSLLMIDDMAAVIKLNEACNDLGMDVISCGATIAMAMDCFENNLIGPGDTDGLEVKWGDADVVLKLIEKIARREGFGDVLADGAKRAAVKIGGNASDYAVEVKGMEAPMHDPRAYHGLGLSYATGVRGACHTNDLTYSIEQGLFVWPEVGIKGGYQGQSSEGKAEMVVISQNLGMITNSAIICYMLMPVIDSQDLVDLMRAATGYDYDLEELMTCGERIWMLKRGLDNLMGITASDDRLPRQILTATEEGPAAGSVPDLELMLKEYYPLRGLEADGRPSKEKLGELGLSELADRL